MGCVCVCVSSTHVPNAQCKHNTVTCAQPLVCLHKQTQHHWGRGQLKAALPRVFAPFSRKEPMQRVKLMDPGKARRRTAWLWKMDPQLSRSPALQATSKLRLRGGGGHRNRCFTITNSPNAVPSPIIRSWGSFSTPGHDTGMLGIESPTRLLRWRKPGEGTEALPKPARWPGGRAAPWAPRELGGGRPEVAPWDNAPLPGPATDLLLCAAAGCSPPPSPCREEAPFPSPPTVRKEVQLDFWEERRLGWLPHRAPCRALGQPQPPPSQQA